ncbi:phosphoribosylpyrophosphate synthetase [Pontibacter qinzhouensis]|uniref:Phosphoribosylpyrophosphate synthetase n=1 Tax=Pontibacter qinzhouensis TaxID=2603253 RepID=A0A5C8K7R6_9BACT|nr:phosphoribosylpyrophosphate synthetase [Pontibacter qinzhouensis]TXK45866.1 phosphoribosylpyrophosphate synthetase [Pontibacter qinzhouensis]
MSKYNYDTVVEALDDLRKRGYTEGFSLRPYCLECPQLQLELGAREFKIDEVHRFEDASSPDDSSVVYAISSDRGMKGVLVDAYGTYADSVTSEMAYKLKIG